jgi:anti-sigma factor RsiW
MTCDEIQGRLDAYLARELEPAERALVSEHLAGCAPCRAEAQAWSELFDRTARLPRSIEPPRDLWPEIDLALDEPAVVPIRRRRGLGSMGLVAAAVALVVVTATLTTMLTRDYDTAMARKLKGMESTAPTTPATEAEYRAVTEDLLRSLEAQGLPPATMTIVRRNLEVIDGAILELQGALAQDPANADLSRMLLATYQRKLDLLEQAARAGEG